MTTKATRRKFEAHTKNQIAVLTDRVARIIAAWEAGDTNAPIDSLNDLHDRIYELEQEVRLSEIGPTKDKGDYNDRTSAWHY